MPSTKLTRRTFLKSSAIGGTQLFILTDNSRANPNHSDLRLDVHSSRLILSVSAGPSFNNALFGIGSAYALKDKKEQRERTLRALSYIFSQRIAVESDPSDPRHKTPSQAAAEIRQVINTEKSFDPNTFGDVAKALEGSSTTSLHWNLLVNSALAGGLGAAGGWVQTAELLGPEAVGIAAALAAGGVVASTFVNEFTKDDNLIAPPSDAEVLQLTSWALTRFAELSSPQVMSVAIDLHNSGHLPIDPNASPNDSLKSLPQAAQSIINPQVIAGTATAAQVEATVRTAIKNSLQKFDETAAKLLKELENERNEAVRARKEAQARQEAEFIAAELNGVGSIANFLFSRVFNNASLGNKVQTFVQAGARAYLALMTPGIGPLALAGHIADAFNSVIGLFGDSDALNAALNQINEKLDFMSKQLEMIATQQETILRTLSQVLIGVASTHARLNDVSNQLSALAQGSSEEHFDIERNDFLQKRGELGTTLTTFTAEQIQSDPSLRNNYAQHISNCVTYANETAKSSSHAANFVTAISQTDWLSHIRTRNRCDRLIGGMVHIANALDIPLPEISNSGTLKPANPTAWAEGVNALLTGRTKASLVALDESDKTNAKKLWRDGQYLRELIIALTTPDTVAKVFQKLLDAAGVPPATTGWNIAALQSGNSLVAEIFKAAREFDTANVPRSLTSVMNNGGGVYFAIFPGQSLPPSGAASTLRVDFSFDYFKKLRDNNLITQTDCEMITSFMRACNFKVTADGPHKNSLLTSEKVGFLSPTFSSIVYPTSGGSVRNPWELQRQSMDLVHGLINRPQLQSDNGIHKAISDHFNPALKSNFQDFDFWGALARLLCTFVNWRTCTEETPEILALQNSYGPFSVDELLLHVKEYIEKRLSFAGFWPFEIAQSVESSIRSAADRMRTAASLVATDKSVPTVDETLRRLSGFMGAHNIDLELI